MIETRADLPHHRQSVRFGVGQRLQQNVVDQAEDRRRRPHADAECHDGERGEGRTPDERTRGGAHVPAKGIEPCADALITNLFLDDVNMSELATRGTACIVA
ncbi:hypothetical protein D3C83_47100 [compost metagenome]